MGVKTAHATPSMLYDHAFLQTRSAHSATQAPCRTATFPSRAVQRLSGGGGRPLIKDQAIMFFKCNPATPSHAPAPTSQANISRHLSSLGARSKQTGTSGKGDPRSDMRQLSRLGGFLALAYRYVRNICNRMNEQALLPRLGLSRPDQDMTYVQQGNGR